MPSMKSIRLLQQIIHKKHHPKRSHSGFSSYSRTTSVRTAPGEPALLIRKPRRKRSKRHRLQKIARCSSLSTAAFRPTAAPSYRRYPGSVNRTQSAHPAPGRVPRVCALNQGAHTVSHQNKRKIRVILFAHFVTRNRSSTSPAPPALYINPRSCSDFTLVPAVIMNHTHYTAVPP